MNYIFGVIGGQSAGPQPTGAETVSEFLFMIIYLTLVNKLTSNLWFKSSECNSIVYLYAFITVRDQ